MANVIGSRDGERAQLILVSGLTIAATLVVLILLLNTMIYTENVATRGVHSDVGEAAQFEETVVIEIQAILEAEHEQAPVNGSDFIENVTIAIDHLGTHQAETAIQRGVVVELNVNTVVPGIYLDQDEEEELQDFSMDNVETIGTATLSVNGSSWQTENHTDPVQMSIGDRSLMINATHNETIEIWDDADEFSCEIDNPNVTIDLDFINRSVTTNDEADHCEETLWEIRSSETPLLIELDTGDRAPTGEYELEVIGTNISSDQGTMFVFEVETELRYESGSLVFEGTRTDRGEPP